MLWNVDVTHGSPLSAPLRPSLLSCSFQIPVHHSSPRIIGHFFNVATATTEEGRMDEEYQCQCHGQL